MKLKQKSKLLRPRNSDGHVNGYGGDVEIGRIAAAKLQRMRVRGRFRSGSGGGGNQGRDKIQSRKLS